MIQVQKKIAITICHYFKHSTSPFMYKIRIPATSPQFKSSKETVAWSLWQIISMRMIQIPSLFEGCNEDLLRNLERKQYIDRDM